MGNIGHVVSSDRVGDLPHFGVVDLSRVGGTAGNEDLGLNFFCPFGNLLVVEDAGCRVGSVKVGLIDFGGKGDGFALWQFPAMAQVPAVVETHPEHFVPRLEEGGVDRKIGDTAGRALEVDVPNFLVETEKFECALFD